MPLSSSCHPKENLVPIQTAKARESKHRQHEAASVTFTYSLPSTLPPCYLYAVFVIARLTQQYTVIRRLHPLLLPLFILPRHRTAFVSPWARGHLPSQPDLASGLSK